MKDLRVHKRAPTSPYITYIPVTSPTSIMWYNQSDIINLLSARLVTSSPKMLLALSLAAEPTPCPWPTSPRFVVCESTWPRGTPACCWRGHRRWRRRCSPWRLRKLMKRWKNVEDLKRSQPQQSNNKCGFWCIVISDHFDTNIMI